MKPLFIALLFIGVGIGLFGQEDEDSLSVKESFWHKDLSFTLFDDSADREGTLIFGFSGAHLMFKDDLVSANTYSGIGPGILTGIEVWNRKMHYNIPVELHFIRLSPSSSDILNSSDFINYNLVYFEWIMDMIVEVNIKESPHYLGAMFSMNGVGVRAVKQELEIEDGEGYDLQHDFLTPFGVSYLYRDKILGIPLSVNFTLPLIYYRTSRTSASLGHGGSVTDYFKPKIKIDLFSKKTFKSKEPPDWWYKVSYIWTYTNMNRETNFSYRHRHLTNAIGLQIGWGKK